MAATAKQDRLDFLNATAKAVIDTEVEAAFSFILPAGGGHPLIWWVGDAPAIIRGLRDLVREIESIQARDESGRGTMPLRLIDPGQPAPPPATNEDIL